MTSTCQYLLISWFTWLFLFDDKSIIFNNLSFRFKYFVNLDWYSNFSSTILFVYFSLCLECCCHYQQFNKHYLHCAIFCIFVFIFIPHIHMFHMAGSSGITCNKYCPYIINPIPRASLVPSCFAVTWLWEHCLFSLSTW